MDVLKTAIFDNWLKKLKDRRAKAIIQVHINRLIEDKPGNIRALNSNLHEKKIRYGPGYRLYLYLRDQKCVILLCGGDKSTQQDDIKKAKKIVKEIIKDLKGKK